MNVFLSNLHEVFFFGGGGVKHIIYIFLIIICILYDFKHDESMIWGTSFFNKPHKSSLINVINVIQYDNTMNLKCLLSESLKLREKND